MHYIFNTVHLYIARVGHSVHELASYIMPVISIYKMFGFCLAGYVYVSELYTGKVTNVMFAGYKITNLRL